MYEEEYIIKLDLFNKKLTELDCHTNELTELPEFSDNPQLLKIFPSYKLYDIIKIQKFKRIYYQKKIYKFIINFIKRYKFKKIEEELMIKTWHHWCLSIDTYAASNTRTHSF
jgi:hypothetical protein